MLVTLFEKECVVVSGLCVAVSLPSEDLAMQLIGPVSQLQVS